MDIREIQRLHAQFAPDSTVIDLPRQIAALPGPGDFPDPEPSRMSGRLAPRARQATIAVAVAAVVAMAGMGAATLYTGLKAGHSAAPVASTASPVVRKQGEPLSAATGTPAVAAYREVDASAAHPVSAAPALSASDFATARSLGLTADQFRDSLKAPAHGAQTAPAGAAALSNEAQLAAASPIHRAEGSREAATVAPQPAQPGQPAQAEPVAPTKPGAPTQNAQAPAAPAPATTAQAPAATAQPAQIVQPTKAAPVIQGTQQGGEATRPARAAHRHIPRPRAPQNAESSTDPKPSAESHTGSAEVKMF